VEELVKEMLPVLKKLMFPWTDSTDLQFRSKLFRNMETAVWVAAKRRKCIYCLEEKY
jgi:hypothetical protein